MWFTSYCCRWIPHPCLLCAIVMLLHSFSSLPPPKSQQEQFPWSLSFTPPASASNTFRHFLELESFIVIQAFWSERNYVSARSSRSHYQSHPSSPTTFQSYLPPQLYFTHPNQITQSRVTFLCNLRWNTHLSSLASIQGPNQLFQMRQRFIRISSNLKCCIQCSCVASNCALGDCFAEPSCSVCHCLLDLPIADHFNFPSHSSTFLSWASIVRVSPQTGIHHLIFCLDSI